VWLLVRSDRKLAVTFTLHHASESTVRISAEARHVTRACKFCNQKVSVMLSVPN